MSANIVRKNLEKSGNTSIIVVIASLASIVLVKGARKVGVEVDVATATTAATVVISGIIAGVQNWAKHRKAKKAPAPLVP